jgi:hypothetical protein
VVLRFLRSEGLCHAPRGRGMAETLAETHAVFLGLVANPAAARIIHSLRGGPVGFACDQVSCSVAVNRAVAREHRKARGDEFPV